MNAFPCDFRVGSTGFGLIGGIGAGVGFLTPLQLGGIPAFGQIAGALVGSLSRVDSALRYPTHKVRGQIQRSAVKGLDCSAGCGVFVGYGYGIGLFLKPQAAEAMQQSMQKAHGHVRAALQRALPQHGAEHDSGKAHPVWAGGRANQPSQLGHQLSNAASSEQGSEAGAVTDLGGTAVPLKRPAHPDPVGTTHRGAGEPKNAESSEHAVDAHRQALVSGSTAMTEATAQRLIDALNAHHTGLAETSQTLSQASSDLKGVCLLLKGLRHRF